MEPLPGRPPVDATMLPVPVTGRAVAEEFKALVVVNIPPVIRTVASAAAVEDIVAVVEADDVEVHVEEVDGQEDDDDDWDL